MKKNCVCGVTALLVFGVLYVAEAVADEMTMAPAAFITSPASSLAWTGFYIGGNGGFGWSSSSVSYSPNDAAAQAGTCGGVGKGKCIPSADYSTVGALAGGQVGFNWQINSVWLTGVEADYQWANLTGLGVSPFHLGNVAKLSMCSPPGRARFHQEGSPISALSAAHLVFRRIVGDIGRADGRRRRRVCADQQSHFQGRNFVRRSRHSEGDRRCQTTLRARLTIAESGLA